MPVKGTVITKSNILDSFRENLTKNVNNVIVWHTGNKPSEMPDNILGGGAEVTPDSQPDEVGGPPLITASEIAETMGEYLSLFTRIRRCHYIERFGRTNVRKQSGTLPEPTYEVTFESTEITHLDDSYRVLTINDCKTIVEGLGIIEDELVTASVINSVINQLAETWENASNDTIDITVDLCHSSCHVSCHGSRGRR